MPTTYKNARVQGTSSTGTYATLYTSPSATQAVVSSLSICNTSATAATYRVGIMTTAGTPAGSDWLVYDSTVAGNDSVFVTLGITLSANQFIRVSSSANTVAFLAFVSEIS